MSAKLRLAGIPIEIRPSFLVIIVLLGLPARFDASIVAWVAMATIAVLVHELGHAAVVLAYGGSPQIVLLASGGLTYFQSMGARRHLAVALAGPLAGAALGVAALAVTRLAPGLLAPDLAREAMFVTFGWSALNLLPVGGLDGRAALEHLLTVLLGRPVPAVVQVVGLIAVVALVGVTLLVRAYTATFMVVFMTIVTALPSIVGLGGGRRATDGPSMLRLGQADRALAWTDDRLATGRVDLATWVVRADALRQLTRWAEADEVYTAILTDHPGDPRALAGRAQTLRMRGLVAEADADLARLLAVVPVRDEALGPAFMALHHAGRFADALRLVEDRLARGGLDGPTRTRIEGLRLATLTTMGRAEEALPGVDRQLAAAPDEFVVHELRALLLVQLGRAQEACRSADHALAGAPDHPELLETAGVAQRLAGRPDVARVMLLRSAAARPDMPRARAELAACNAHLGRVEEAEGSLLGLGGWAAADPNVTYARACIAARAGRTQEAAALVEEAATGRPCLGRIARWDPVFHAGVAAAAAGTGLAAGVQSALHAGDAGHLSDGADPLPRGTDPLPGEAGPIVG